MDPEENKEIKEKQEMQQQGEAREEGEEGEEEEQAQAGEEAEGEAQGQQEQDNEEEGEGEEEEEGEEGQKGQQKQMEEEHREKQENEGEGAQEEQGQEEGQEQGEEGEQEGQQVQQQMVNEADNKEPVQQQAHKDQQQQPKKPEPEGQPREIPKEPEPVPKPVQPQIKSLPVQPAHVHTQPHQKPTPTPTPMPSLSLQSQKYINTLQTTLKSKQSHIQSLLSTQQTLLHRVSTLEQQSKSLKSGQLQKTQQIFQLNKKQKQHERELTALKAKVVGLEDELVCYREVGDIKLMQARVEELEGLVQGYRREIEIGRGEDSGKGMEDRREVMGREYMEKLEGLESEKEGLEIRVRELELELSRRTGENVESAEIMNKIDQQLKEKMERIASLEEQLANERTTQTAAQQALHQKIHSLTTQLQQPQAHRPQTTSSIPQEQVQSPHTQILKLENEKDIIFREYLKLQLEHKSVLENFKDLKGKYQGVCRDLRAVKKDMVSKKDYQEVLLRYRKTKGCLEKAIQANKLLQNNNQIQHNLQQSPNNPQPSQQPNQQTLTKKYLHILTTHIQQSISYTKQTNNIMQQLHNEKYQAQLKLREQELQDLQERYGRLDRLNGMMERELVYKNSLLDRLGRDFGEVNRECDRLRKEKLGVQATLADNIGARSTLKRLEAKSAALLVRNRKILTEKENWKQLYEQIKAKYEHFITRDPNYRPPQSQSTPQPATIQPLQAQKPNKAMQQGQIEQQPSLIPQKPATFSTQSQTQGLNQLYYKQIKQTLSAIKKFPQLIKSTTQNYQKIGKDLEDYKKRYDQVTQKYNMKFRALQNEKNENDSWREGMRRQILGEFQDIRELVQGERLLACLRKAKNLIEYLEQQEEEEGEASA